MGESPNIFVGGQTMKLSVDLVPGASYSWEAREFLVDLVISTDVSLEISLPADVSAALLSSTENADVTFGYVKRVTPAKRQTALLSTEEPLRMRINVLEHDEDFEDFRPGSYQCDVKVEVGAKEGKEFRIVQLQGSVLATLA
jgi:hypothetical protein